MLELSDISSEAVIERKDQADVQDIMDQAINQSCIILHTRPGDKDSDVEFAKTGSLAKESVVVRTNKLYAVRALSQILENAAKFTYKGSITLQVEYTDSKVRFIVEDTGVGIPVDEAEHVFDEFVQLDEFADGTGIGLTVARSIAQRMGGDLWLDTNYTQGARFVFEILRK
jgi:signal transduction histidine kinase